MKRKYNIPFISILVLLIGFVFCRYVFFGVHGMKQWPTILFVSGLVGIAVSSFFKCKFISISASFGYIIAFVLAVLFEQDYAEPTGAVTMNSLWIIWTVSYLCYVLLGVIVEIVKRYEKK